ncbi:MAG: hypothetical protein IK016_11840 [Lachnospiraceae bacterium]|nr:hypothetical protein [Lachnospiraceae bacterium]
MEVPVDLIAKLETLPEDKFNIVASLINQFAVNVNPAASAAGAVLSQPQIDKLIEDIRAGIVA